MLQSVAVKVSLKEPRARFLEMMRLLQSFGTRRAYLVHVATGNDGRQEKARQKMAQLGEQVRELGFEAAALVKAGHPPTQVVWTARELGVDYLALYWLPKALLVQALMGSIDADILRMSDLPVFVYNRGYMSASTRLERVLYATDFQTTDSRVMPYLINKEFQAKQLFLLHVGERAPDPETEHRRQRCVQENLERLAAECGEAYEQVTPLQVVGRRRKQILRQAYLNQVDLIVIGKADKPGSLKNVLGSTAEALPDRSKRSVFIVPGTF